MKKEFIFLLFFIHCFLIVNAQNDTLKNGIVTFYYPGTKTISSQGLMRDGNPDGYWKNYYLNGSIKSEGNRKNFLLDSTWNFYNDSSKLLVSINYINGKKNGLKTTFRDSEIVTENFKDDIKEGFTTYYHKNKTERLKINFINGLEQGSAIEYDSTKRIITFYEYKNGFLVNRERINRTDNNGLKQGKWKFFYENDIVEHEGTYRNDKKNGYFKYFDKKGNLLSIKKFINDVEETQAPEIADIKVKTDYYPNGKVKTVGLYKNDVAEGLRTEYSEDGEITATYIFSKGIITSQGIIDEEGNKQGEWKEYYSNGSLKSVGIYQNDKPIGIWKYYFENGKIESEGKYTQKGNTEGVWKWYYEDGSLRRIESYFNGLEDGEFIEYDEVGNIIVKGFYDMGLETGKWLYDGTYYKEEGEYRNGAKYGLWKTYYSDGTVKFEGNYVDDNLDGKAVWYWSNGKPKDEVYYKNGRKHGKYTYYNEDGSIFLVVIYQNDIEKYYDGVKIKPPFNE